MIWIDCSLGLTSVGLAISAVARSPHPLFLGGVKPLLPNFEKEAFDSWLCSDCLCQVTIGPVLHDVVNERIIISETGMQDRSGNELQRHLSLSQRPGRLYFR